MGMVFGLEVDGENVKKIILTKNKSALVSNIDFPRINRHKWRAVLNHALGTWYAVREGSRKLGRTTIYMHQFIRCHTSRVDHKNGNGLDNRRINLRDATRSQNGANMKRPRHNTSGYKGVTWDKARACWVAQIKVLGRRHYLGGFRNRSLAHLAYCAAARNYFEEFAKFA